MSPVPGGRSTSRKSGSSHHTSVRNCSSALWSIGPRQMTAWSSRAKNPMEMQRTPCTSGGTSISSMTVGGRSTPSMRGMEKPHTSASSTATERPRFARATARLTVVDDLPTPPLPEAMRSTRVRLAGSANGMARPSEWPTVGFDPAVAEGSPCNRWRSAARSSSVIEVKPSASSSTSGSASTTDRTRRSISFFSGHPGMVSAMVRRTVPPSTVTSRTMSRSTMLRCSSGSSTGRRASMMSAGDGTQAPGVVAVPAEFLLRA